MAPQPTAQHPPSPEGQDGSRSAGASAGPGEAPGEAPAAQARRPSTPLPASRERPAERLPPPRRWLDGASRTLRAGAGSAARCDAGPPRQPRAPPAAGGNAAGSCTPSALPGNDGPAPPLPRQQRTGHGRAVLPAGGAGKAHAQCPPAPGRMVRGARGAHAQRRQPAGGSVPRPAPLTPPPAAGRVVAPLFGRLGSSSS